jgi:hypothetical protein
LHRGPRADRILVVIAVIGARTSIVVANHQNPGSKSAIQLEMILLTLINDHR